MQKKVSTAIIFFILVGCMQFNMIIILNWNVLVYMGISESIIKHTITCCENICEEVDCEIDSGCCKTHFSALLPNGDNSSTSSS
jgi:hypothetical protein